MKKVFHSNLHAWAIPQNLTEPIAVATTHCSFSEIEKIVAKMLKNLRPFQGSYSLHVEFTEPNTDPQFKLGHVGCVISVFAETKDLRDEMLIAL